MVSTDMEIIVQVHQEFKKGTKLREIAKKAGISAARTNYLLYDKLDVQRRRDKKIEVSDYIREKVKQLHRFGYTDREIGEDQGITPETVRKILNGK